MTTSVEKFKSSRTIGQIVTIGKFQNCRSLCSEVPEHLEQWSPTLVLKIYFLVESNTNYNLLHLLQLI